MASLVKLDRIDVNILAKLQKNSQLTNVELAGAVGLSPSPCLSRVKRLEKSGYIISYNAHLDLSKLVDHITVFTQVTLNDHRREDFIKFEAEIRRHNTLQECHLVSGGFDYMLKFVARSVAHYQQIMERVLDCNIGVDKYFSYIVIKSIILRDSVELKALMTDE
jgi:DNA-binding Lrp family transcriptional regulator